MDLLSPGIGFRRSSFQLEGGRKVFAEIPEREFGSNERLSWFEVLVIHDFLSYQFCLLPFFFSAVRRTLGVC